jgi:LEA14-like dessication related protein
MSISIRPGPVVTARSGSAGGRRQFDQAPMFFAFARAACLLALISGCATSGPVNPPRVTLADLRLVEVSLVEQRYAAKLRIQNPNEADLGVRGMEYTIFINGRKFADGVSGRHFTVPGFGETIVQVDLTSTVLRMFEQLQNLSSGESKVFRYGIAGSLSLDGFRGSVPFSHEDQIDLSPDAGT